MKIILRTAFAIVFFLVAADAWSQCSNPPTVSATPTVQSVGTTTATLRGNVSASGGGGGCNVDETGIEWSTTAGGPYTVVEGSETGTGNFDVDVTGLPVATQIFFRAYAENNDSGEPTGYSNEISFYTLAPEPAAHAVSLTATALNNDEIYLQFPPASDIADAVGYVILMEDNATNPNTNNLANGGSPTAASDYLATITDPSATDYTVSNLDPSEEYRFAIIPYNRVGHDDTRHYRTTTPFIIASATTESEVDVNPLATGLAGATLNSATTNRALVGFELVATGPMTFESVVIRLTGGTTAGKLTNFRLCSSADNDFDGIATDPPIGGASFNITSTEITITLSQAITATHRYFLVADVEPGVASSASVRFQYNEDDFTFDPDHVVGTGSQDRTYNFADVTAPILVSTIPADNSTGVDFTINKFVMTFNEQVANISTSVDAANRVEIYAASNTVTPVVIVNRTLLVSNGTSTIDIPIPAGMLAPNTDYFVKIGGAVIEDVPADNDWPGINDQTTWNFRTSGVVVNNVTSAICGGSFQSIGDIVISEVGVSDFIASGSVQLDFANANFGYDISSVSVTAGPASNTDITSVSLNPKTLTRLTLNFTLDGTNDKVDVITISGLKVYASGPGSTTIINGNSLAGVMAIDQPVTFATINVGASAPSGPTLVTADLKYCRNEDLSGTTVQVQNNGGTFTWYNNATLSTQLATGATVNVSDLGINSAVVGDVTRYVVRIDGCQSTALPVTFQVVPIPVADAGPPSLDVCSGSSVTLGGTPTLAGPSVAGAYQYLWSTSSPGGFTDMGSNPQISPTSTTDETINYTVKIVDANGCASDITLPESTIAVNVKSTDEAIVYESPLSTSFTLNNSEVELKATPSINSFYSGNGVYLSNGKYYFDPDLAGTAGSPHTITYTTELTNGCVTTDTRQFSVSTPSGTIVNIASSYCANEIADPSKVLSLGPDWQNYLAADNAYYQAYYGYTYEFYDFQVFGSNGLPAPGIVGDVSVGQTQHVNPSLVQPYVPGVNYFYAGMRVRRKVPPILGPLGEILLPTTYDPPIFWNLLAVTLYTIPDLKIAGIRAGQIVCDVDQQIELEGINPRNDATGTFQIGRNQTNWVSGPTVGIIDNPFNSGKALLNPHTAYTSLSFPAPHNTPAAGITDFYVRYNYVVPATQGSNGAPCATSIVVPFQISNNPPVDWVALAESEFCYEATGVEIQTVQSNGVTFSGYGVKDLGGGKASLDPIKALELKAFATNSPPYTNYNAPEDIIISATRTDGNGCKTTINQTVSVHPLFPASFTEADLALCYEDGTQDIVGGQPNGFFVLNHPDLGSITIPTTFLDDFNFRTYFDQAVAAGAPGKEMQTFKLTLNTSDPALGCENSVSKTFTVNAPFELDITGMSSGMVVCGNGTPLALNGTYTAGSFDISETSPTSGFISEAFGLDNISAGVATYTPSGAGLAPGSAQKDYYIRYSYLGPGCNLPAQTTEHLVVNPQPAITLSGSIPAPNTPYCFEQSATPTTVTLSTIPSQSSNVTFSGFGIQNTVSGTAIFNPTSAYQQSSLNDNLNPLTDQTIRNIAITATRTDAQSCQNMATVTYIVNPLPLAGLDPIPSEMCYEDNAVVFEGDQTNVKWQIIYKNTTPPNYSPAPFAQPTLTFDPSSYFDDAVTRGANGLATLQFDVIYTAISNTTGCTNQLSPVPVKVSPKIPVSISGIEPDEVFCSNTTDRLLEVSPVGGVLTMNGNIVINTGGSQFKFDPPIAGPQGGMEFTFIYALTTGSNCSNTLTKKVRVLPSPVASFDVDPACDQAVIPYDAVAGGNLASTVYTWTLSGEVKTGQHVTHQFPGISSYYAKLKAEHPAFDLGGGQLLVCSDSSQLDQIVGPYPTDIDIAYFNVCEGDETNFVVSSSFPINRASWDFGDGVTTDFGILSEPLVAPNTTGSYQAPIHKYVGAYDELEVVVVAKTPDNFGGCPYAKPFRMSILKKWEPSGGNLRYAMSELDNGGGFWVKEDPNGNATWEFDVVAKQAIQTDEMAWVTGANQPYKAEDASYVNSPCFDLSDFSRPVISIQHWTNTEESDGAVLQYSTTGGQTWQRLGDVATGLDWYNRPVIPANPGGQTGLLSGWSASDQINWAVGKHTLDMLSSTDREKVRFRIAFASYTNSTQRDGFAFNNVVIEERNRTILVENFTTVAEAGNNDEFKLFRADEDTYEFNSTELVKLQYHHAPAQYTTPLGALHEINPTDPNARAAFYGITNASRAFIDGGFGQASPIADFKSVGLDVYFSLRSLVTSPVNINVELDDEPSDRLNVRATVQATTEVGAAGQYNVFIAIAEQSVNGQQYVLRKFLPDAAGIPLTALSVMDPAQEINVSYDMRHVTRTETGFAPFAVIVFVQNLQTKDVLQTVMLKNGTAPTDVVTGIETSYEDALRLYPNPADEILNIVLPAPVNTHTPVRIYDTFGREVYSDMFEPEQRMKSVQTKNLSTGVYLIQVSTPKGVMQKKAMVVHD